MDYHSKASEQKSMMEQLKITIGALLMCTLLHANAGVIVRFQGTPCAGKTTLSRAVAARLGNKAQYIDRDELGHQLIQKIVEKLLGRPLAPHESALELQNKFRPEHNVEIAQAWRKADAHSIALAEQYAQQGLIAIVDGGRVQEIKTHLPFLHVLLYAPLPELLIREKIRSKQRNYTVEQRMHTQKCIFYKYRRLYESVQNKKEYIIDTMQASRILEVTRCALEEHPLNKFTDMLHKHTKQFVQHFNCAHRPTINITPRHTYDVIFNLCKCVLPDAVDHVVQKIANLVKQPPRSEQQVAPFAISNRQNPGYVKYCLQRSAMKRPCIHYSVQPDKIAHSRPF